MHGAEIWPHVAKLPITFPGDCDCHRDACATISRLRWVVAEVFERRHGANFVKAPHN